MSVLQAGKRRSYVVCPPLSGSQKSCSHRYGQSEFSPAYVIRILRQFGYSEAEIDDMLC